MIKILEDASAGGEIFEYPSHGRKMEGEGEGEGEWGVKVGATKITRHEAKVSRVKTDIQY